MEQIVLEIRSAEGGEDSRLLVVDLLSVYVRVGSRRGL